MTKDNYIIEFPNILTSMREMCEHILGSVKTKDDIEMGLNDLMGWSMHYDMLAGVYGSECEAYDNGYDIQFQMASDLQKTYELEINKKFTPVKNTKSLKIESTRIGLINTINALVLTVLFTSIFFN